MTVTTILAAILGCGSTDISSFDEELVFVRGGLIIPATDQHIQTTGRLRQLAEKRHFVELDWSPHQAVNIGGFEGVAPEIPECRPLFHVELSELSTISILSGTAPNSVVRFSPDGSMLAVGGQNGELVVVDGWSGEEIARTILAEAATKLIEWSNDGSTIYVAEQSPDAFLHALNPSNLEILWSFRLADFIDTSPMPAGEDRYGIYDLPAGYFLEVLPDGDLVVVGMHGWNLDDDTRANKSQLFRLTPDGEIVSRFPASPISVTFNHAAIHSTTSGSIIALNTGRSADGPPPDDLPVSAITVVDLTSSDQGVMELLNSHRFSPLEPWFTTAYMWQALDIDPDKGVLVGLGDGRLLVFDEDGEGSANPTESSDPILTLSSGTPVMAGAVPISTSIGFGRFVGDTMVTSTADTNIPWGAASPELRPPTNHPGANTVRVHNLEGEALWYWQSEIRIQGLSVSEDQTKAVVAAGFRPTDRRRDLYGAFVLDLTEPENGEGGDARLLASCETPNPLFFQHEIQNDGRIAVIEYPYSDGEGSVIGDYRATVLR